MTVIDVHHVVKRFRIATAPRTFFNMCKRILKSGVQTRDFLALKDITFAVEEGDRVALIGDNGSGKTTLLRILAGLYRQTGGTVKVLRPAATFLQLGIGMERELTAFDNIFLFGTIMGIDRERIAEKVVDILRFAELEDFLYVPLRDFSTGMIQRLAISILRHVEADILLLDEMLVSGDVKFQEKCFRLFESYTQMNKTMVIVSHDPLLLKRFCTKALWLQKGTQRVFGPLHEVLDRYLRE